MTLSSLLMALAVVSMCCDGPAVEDRSPKPLSPVEARQRVGEEVLVEMTVKVSKDRLEKRGEIYLDSELDFRDDKNFAAVINRSGAALFKQQGVTDFESHFRDKTVRVRGKVTVVENVPRIEVSDPRQIELVHGS